MRALGGGLPRSRVAQRLHMRNRLGDGHFEIREVDWLRQKIEGSAVHRGADVGHVAVGGNDNGRELRRLVLKPRKQGQPVHARHVDVGDDHVVIPVFLQEGERLHAVARKPERHRAFPDLAAELLRDQILQVWLVVDNQDF